MLAMSRCSYLNFVDHDAEMWIKYCSEQYRRATDVLEGNGELTTEAFNEAYEVRDDIFYCPLYACAFMLSSTVEVVAWKRACMHQIFARRRVYLYDRMFN